MEVRAVRTVSNSSTKMPMSMAQFVTLSLHLFSDASENGYRMCAYLRFAYASGTGWRVKEFTSAADFHF